MSTVDEYPHKATAWILFPTIGAASKAVMLLKKQCKVDAVEILDRACLSAVENKGNKYISLL